MAKTILPPGLTAADFADALEAFRKVVGKDYVYTGDQLTGYVDPYSIESDPDAHSV
ncbi:MAG: hypothetical protein RLZZ393_1635, partial [Pseudomonadota bacterium]